jgi:hypothetical protein
VDVVGLYVNPPDKAVVQCMDEKSQVQALDRTLNMIERFVAAITDKAIRRGVFHSVDDLMEAIDEYLRVHNNDPVPFVWTATAEDILAKVARARSKLNTLSSHS